MANLVYLMLASVDGFVADENGNFDWAEPDEEVHAFVNDLSRSVGTHLYGRKMYDVMAVWENLPDFDTQPPVMQDFARSWQAAEKVVFSKTMQDVRTDRTRLERSFDPEKIAALKQLSSSDLSVSGPGLAAQAIGAGLVDVLHIFLAPMIVGGGNRLLPDRVRSKLELLDQRHFESGFAYVHYLTVQ
ncbi:MAG: dihydrofolate reductase family protein [Acidimicrobiia bacterium]